MTSNVSRVSSLRLKGSMEKINRRFLLVFIPFLLVVLLGFFLFGKDFYTFYQDTFFQWHFAGFSSLQTFDPVYEKRFRNQTRCAQFGQEWLHKQRDSQPIFICANQCFDKKILQIGEYVGGCAYVCRYDQNGLKKCNLYPPPAGS